MNGCHRTFDSDGSDTVRFFVFPSLLLSHQGKRPTLSAGWRLLNADLCTILGQDTRSSRCSGMLDVSEVETPSVEKDTHQVGKLANC